MRITFVTRKFGNVECNSHCDVLHITPVRVARLVQDCNGVFAIKAFVAIALASNGAVCSATMVCARHKKNLRGVACVSAAC